MSRDAESARRPSGSRPAGGDTPSPAVSGGKANEGVGETSPLEILRRALPELTGAKLRVAEVVLRDPSVVGRSSITWLAGEARTSPATITRLSTALGFDGFPELRAALAREHGRGVQAGWEQDIGSAISPDDPPEKVLSTLAANQFSAARNATASVDLDAMARVADRIVSAQRVQLFGEWGDAPPAYELQLRLFRIGIPVWYDEGAYFTQVGASLLAPGDVALVISRSGDSPIAMKFVEVAREHGAMTVLITGDLQSPLAGAVDVPLHTGTGVGGSWTDYFAGRSSDSLLGALLWALVAQRVPDRIYDRMNHDGTPPPRKRSQAIFDNPQH
ncbi:MurR/RpiR family transcriptional regulator [Streptomyces microflavus]|uniref:MurR/RpiR family transcriptional regulator n=1 Tax=Streptomyces microflavus TaxID=1919 RepID=UPI002DD810F4|nr:MurR/RpiR family transcriptional regulator [Streptomyces microflavus]WSA58887.1 MurR/RpiR family transcriptional regulator [Streptomyces microflavus]